MNKKALEKFAVEARRDLLEKVALKAEQYGITPDNQTLDMEENFGQLIVNGKSFPTDIKPALYTLKHKLETIGYEQLIEEVAYTWFNRIVAIRYMEVNQYLPDRVNVLSSSTGKNEPDIMFQYETMDLPIKPEQIKVFIDDGDYEQAYRKLFVAQCNQLNQAIPQLFDIINHYTELLLPDYLLDDQFVIKKLVSQTELVDSFQEVEVIGWMYQFYNKEPKDQAFAKLKKKKKAEKHDIPAITQFFTPKWIVQYMVENSLGQLWLEANPDSALKERYAYYIEPAEQEEEVEKRLDQIRYSNIDLEKLTFLDPCVGSGHVLVYAFDMYYEMYQEAGYLKNEIPQLILEKNLFGIDIDKRAAQLAAFSLLMKAREKSRTVLKKGLKPNVFDIEESNERNKNVILKHLSLMDQEEQLIDTVYDTFEDAKIKGSLIVSPPDVHDLIERISNKINDFSLLEDYSDAQELKDSIKLLELSHLLGRQYDTVVTNPPYMGNRSMNKTLQDFLGKKYPNSKSDLYATFIERAQWFTKTGGINSMVTQHSWMFLSSYEKLRNQLLNNQIVWNLVHLGTRAFEEIGGEVVQTSVQTFRDTHVKSYKATFLRLVDFNNSDMKRNNIQNRNCWYINDQVSFKSIPGAPIAYWASNQVRDIFESSRQFGEIAKPRQGMATSDNDRFLRNWHEVNYSKVGFGFENGYDASLSQKKWFPYNKGGSYRKWYGNNEKVVNWESDGFEVKQYAKKLYKNETRTIKNIQYYFKEGITWSFVSSSYFGVRYTPKGFLFDVGGSSLFPDKGIPIYLSYLASKVSPYLLKFINPTLNFQVGNVSSLPLPELNTTNSAEISNLSNENVNLAKFDWDLFETSWDFKEHPFFRLRESGSFVEIYNLLKKEMTDRFNQVKTNEEGINRIFIDYFGLEKELSPEVTENEVIISQASSDRESRTLLSYFVGTLFGRYSLDVKGLVFAGGDFDRSKYKTFPPNENGIIHLTEDHYFDNDIIARLKEFLSVAFSPDTVTENMQWLAEALEMKKNESAEERLRRYFLDEFFKDHKKTYHNTPIYWLVDSGKEKGLRTLIYMHRYQPDTMATIRFDHLQEVQAKYQNEMDMIDTRIVNPSLSATDKRALEKKKTGFQKKLTELQEFDKKLAVYANKAIEIDLDDGVKHNHALFGDVLAKIK